MKIRWRLLADENEPVTRQRGMLVYKELQKRGWDAGPLDTKEGHVDIIVCQYDSFDLELQRERCDYLMMDIADALFLLHHSRNEVFRRDVPRFCDWLLCCSSRTKYHLESMFDPNCVTLFPEAVDTRYASIKRKPEKKNKIVWMGMDDNASFFKPIDFVLEKLYNEGESFEVVFVHPDLNGSGKSNKDLVDSKPYPTRHVKWEFNTLLSEMSTADIAVCPTLQNEWCRCKAANKAASFASAGIPVVATDIPSYREFIKHGETGYLCFSPDDWYDPLKKLMGSVSLQQKIGKAGKKIAMEMYSIEHVCDVFESAIERMVI